MLVQNKSAFSKGMLLLVTFTAVFIAIMMPLYGPEGKKQNGLEVSDDFFNKLSKDSANYIPRVTKEMNEKITDQKIDVTVKLQKADEAAKAAEIFKKAGAEASAKDTEVKVSGALKPLLTKFIADAQGVYDNDKDGKIKAFYGMDGDKALSLVWEVTSRSIKALQKDKKLDEANILNTLNKRALEPAVNFYGIEGEPVSKNIPALAGLLIFYVIYTMWYGYSIFFLFDGVGMSMKKSKVKKEV